MARRKRAAPIREKAAPVRERRGSAAGAAPRGHFGTSRLRTAIVLVVSVKVAGLILLLSPTGYEGFQPPKSAFSRITEIALVALLALAIARYGTRIVPRTRLHLFVVGFVAANLVAAVFAENRYLAIFGDQTRLEGLTFLGDMLVLYLAAAVVVRGGGDWLIVGGVIAAAGAASMLYAVMQALGLDPVKWAVESRTRPFSTFGNADIYAHFLSSAFGGAIGVVMLGASVRWRVIGGVYAVAVLLIGGASGTRGFLLGAASVLVAVPFVYLRTQPLNRQAIRRVSIAAAAAVVVAVAVLGTTRAGARMVATVTEGALVGDRLAIYESVWSGFLERPILGWGPDSAGPATAKYRSQLSLEILGPTNITSSAHDSILESLVTTGIVGGVAFVAMTASFLFVLYRGSLRKAPLIAGPLLLGLVGYEAHALVSVGSIAIDWVPWLAFGITVAVEGRVPEKLPPIRTVSEAMHAWIMVAATAVGLVIAVPSFLANEQAGAASRFTEAKQNGLAIQAGKSAVSLDGARARYWQRYGTVLFNARDWRAAGDAYAEGTKRAPHLFDNWNGLAVARGYQAQEGDLSRGGWPASVAAVESGLAYDPNNTLLLNTYAFALDGSGQPERALEAAKRALLLLPKDDITDTNVSVASSHVRDQAAARRTLEELLLIKDSATLRIAAARAADRSGDRDGAIAHLRRALDIDPGNREARDALLRVLTGSAL